MSANKQALSAQEGASSFATSSYSTQAFSTPSSTSLVTSSTSLVTSADPSYSSPVSQYSADENSASAIVHAEALAEAALRAAVDQKALDARGLDMRGVSDIADFFVIVSGTSERHVKGIADKIQRDMRELGHAKSVSSGYEEGQWVLLDYGDVVVHIFYEPTRQYYEFDELWKAARPMEIEETLARELRSLRTGIFR